MNRKKTIERISSSQQTDISLSAELANSPILQKKILETVVANLDTKKLVVARSVASKIADRLLDRAKLDRDNRLTPNKSIKHKSLTITNLPRENLENSIVKRSCDAFTSPKNTIHNKVGLWNKIVRRFSFSSVNRRGPDGDFDMKESKKQKRSRSFKHLIKKL